MAWVLLLIASLFEITWAVMLKHTEGFTRLVPTLWTGAALLASVGLLGVASKSIPLGTAYAVWTGIGAAGTAVCGMLLLGEPVTAARVVCLLLIIGGVAGLKFA
jgi:quaternary ammonium compound-resistance protein SugE